MDGLGENINKWRRRRLLTQAELADKIGVKLNTLGSYELNRREPSIAKLVAIADVLKVSTDALLNRDVVFAPINDLTAELLHADEYKLGEDDTYQVQFLMKLLREAGYQLTVKDDDQLEIKTPIVSVSFNRKDVMYQPSREFIALLSSLPVCVVLALKFGAPRLADFTTSVRQEHGGVEPTAAPSDRQDPEPTTNE